MILTPGEQKTVAVPRGKVGFLWEVKASAPVACVVDGMPVGCGLFNPPFVVKSGVLLNANVKSDVSYRMDLYDDFKETHAETQAAAGETVKTEDVAPTKPHIMNHVLNDANTWYEIPIPKDIKTWSMNARGAYDILYSFEPSHSTYRTLFSGTFIDSDTAPNSINKIYVSCATAGAVVEVLLFR